MLILLKSQIFNTKCTNVERVFVLFLGVSLSILTLKFIYLSPITSLDIFSYLFLIALFCSLVFLAYFDFKKMEVHRTASLVLMLVLLTINILLFFAKGSHTEILIFNNWVFSPYQNIMSTLILGCLFQLIVLISKEKALGQGDVRIAIITGLLIGLNNLIYWEYITVFSALIYGLIFAYKKKKFKGLKIPFVPFMVLGIIVLILANI